MGCKKKTITIVKGIAAQLKPHLVRHAVDMVTQIEKYSAEDPLFFTDDVKRRMCGAAIKAEAREAGEDLAGRTVNLLVEFAVEAVKGPEDESDLGEDDTGEAIGIA